MTWSASSGARRSATVRSAIYTQILGGRARAGNFKIYCRRSARRAKSVRPPKLSRPGHRGKHLDKRQPADLTADKLLTHSRLARLDTISGPCWALLDPIPAYRYC
jgi:hypothetical protein